MTQSAQAAFAFGVSKWLNTRVKARARNSDPDTSWAAAASFTPERLTAMQGDVLAFFRQRGPHGATDAELEAALGYRYPGFSTLRKRRSELKQAGWLRDSGQRRKNAGGSSMILWEVTLKGKA